MGGITEFMKVAAMAQAHDLPISSHGKQEVHIHLLSAIPNGLNIEYFGSATDPMWDKKYKETLKITNGFLYPPDRPGIGLELNDEALSPYKIA
jgi:D-arabinonate dehydratase